ncbi:MULTISPECIES: hypothetical protein [Thalassospira]|jgi:hypothetical protein|uniref:Uncharacterized protein n=3 Tax=Thalassospira TaxID=168934 RepID=A0A358HRH0_9PROT|nr:MULTISPECIES: hypothetical protein [Thalassospira]MBV16075.1 hypothetical protein [Thalassospira sp.]PKR57883.1 hypothetical protein COO92_14050 [Thalassospira lohafexi]HBU97773.1 hypothetical protein [Thalassospira lucentensis]HCW69545.1 hypothetical protein [Thalassospira lucentensis]|tara:strand:+ start:15732 stop:15977 length:246 start_codon:yes stop_codon:yes gene_type:complete
MFPLLKKVESWIRNQWVDAAVGFILLFTALNDTGDTLFDDVMSGNVGTSHGVLVLGLAHIIRSVPPVLRSIGLIFYQEKAE